MGDRMHGFNVLRRPLSPVITGSNNFLSIPGAALAGASLPPAIIFRPERGYEFRSPAARQIPICRVMQTFNQKNPPVECRGIFL